MKKSMYTLNLALMIFSSIFLVTTELKAQKITDADLSPFIGQWTLDIDGGRVGWIEVRKENDYLDAELLWVGGSVLPVDNIFMQDNNTLVVTRSSEVTREIDENANPVRTHKIANWLEIKYGDGKISGNYFIPQRNGMGVTSISFSGTKLPDVPPAPDLTKLKFGKPVNLFNGKDLTGWKQLNPDRVNAFRAIDGVMVNDVTSFEKQASRRFANIRTEREFEDFNLKIEVNIPEGSNSGIYLRGMYEIQVYDTYNRGLDSHFMGSVYSRIAPVVKAEKPAGTWQTFDITLCQRHITVILNGVKIIDNQPVYGPTGGAIISDVFAPGPIMLQGDHGEVSYRNIILTPIIYR